MITDIITYWYNNDILYVLTLISHLLQRSGVTNKTTMQNFHAAETLSEAKVSRRILFHEKETWQRHCNLSAGCAINDSVTVYGFHVNVCEVNQKGASQSHTLYYPQINRPLSPVARRLKY